MMKAYRTMGKAAGLFHGLWVAALSVLMVSTPAAAWTLDFIGSAQNTFATLMDETVPFDERFEYYAVEGGSIALSVYTSDKIEKIVFSSIKIESTGVSEESVFIYPAANYEFPVFWANMTRFSFINILIFDFMPLQDLVMTPTYGDTYMEPLNTTKQAVLDDILGRSVRDKAVEFSSKAMYAYSPYKMVARVSLFGALQIDAILDAYGTQYLSLLDSAEVVSGSERRAYATQRLAALRSLLRENDPGYPFMLDVFGETTTQEIMDIIF